MYITILQNAFYKTADKSIEMSWEDMVEFFNEMSTIVVNKKEDSQLFNFNEYNLYERKKEHIKKITAAILDVDGGNVNHEVLQELFKNYEHIVYSSFSNGIKENRYRVIIPFSESCTHLEYASVMLHIRENIFEVNQIIYNDEYVNSDYVNIDKSKCTASSFYYLPCTNKSDRAENVFIHNVGETLDPKQIHRVMLPIIERRLVIADEERKHWKHSGNLPNNKLFDKLMLIGYKHYDDWLRIMFAMSTAGFTDDERIMITNAISKPRSDRVNKIPSRNSSQKITAGTLYYYINQKKTI